MRRKDGEVKHVKEEEMKNRKNKYMKTKSVSSVRLHYFIHTSKQWVRFMFYSVSEDT